MNQKNRSVELDLLRLVSIIAVISIHVDPPAVSYTDMLIRNIEFSMVTWCVPVFVMISGRLFLDSQKEFSIKQLYKKYIKHIAGVFIIWSCIYQIYYLASGTYAELNWKGILTEFIKGPYHMWFLWMICGLYIITPFLKKICEDMILAKYYCLLFIICSFFANYGERLPYIGSVIAETNNLLGLKFVLGFSGYYVLGYVIHKSELSKKKMHMITIIGIVSLILTCALATWLAIKNHEPVEYFAGYQKVNVIFTSIMIFAWFDKAVSKLTFKNNIRKILSHYGKISLGVYVSHALINEILGKIIVDIAVPSSIMTPILTIIVFILSVILIEMIKRIPLVGRYLI